MRASPSDGENLTIELLSSIYEQFLHAEAPEASDKDGAHYTPEPLADYLVSEVDSVCPLKAGMRIRVTIEKKAPHSATHVEALDKNSDFAAL